MCKMLIISKPICWPSFRIPSQAHGWSRRIPSPITISPFLLFVEISIHPTTLNIICPRRLLSGNPRGSGVRPRSRGLEKASGVDHMSWDRALHRWHLPCQWPTRGGALHPPPCHCEGEKRGGLHRLFLKSLLLLSCNS